MPRHEGWCRHLCHLVPLALAWSAAQPALAQQAGLYRGTTSQGGKVDVFVSEGPDGGLNLSWIGHQFSATCTAGKDKLGWYYIPLFEAPIGTEPVTSVFPATWYRETTVLQFTPDGTALEGSFTAIVPAFVDRKPTHWAATACLTGLVSFRAERHQPTGQAEAERASLRLPTRKAAWVARADAQGRILDWQLEVTAR
jgi:hypothetical protein